MWILLLGAVLMVGSAQAACDWPAELADSLGPRCICDSTPDGQRKTVRCGGALDLQILLQGLRFGSSLDMLEISNNSMDHIPNLAFENIEVRALRLSGLGIKYIEDQAFLGLDRALASLDLQGNRLERVPSPALKGLRGLRELDLSGNGITEVADGAFDGLALTTLKLADNPLRIGALSFKGLESSLRNLNLKSCDLESLPPVNRLGGLSLLDLSQNRISELGQGALSGLRQLSALSLERNTIRIVDPRAFEGLNASLSSLSLLNNRIEEFPTEAIGSLTQLRVLDLGFNRLHTVPNDAFLGNPLLTLLALDGNPLSTLSEESFLHLNSTLRGLSLGGSTLVCDCRLRWVVEWVRKRDLQVTSRERNPHFCARPARLRRRTLPQMNPDELRCDDVSSTPKVAAARPTVSPSGVGRDLRAPRTSSFDPVRLTDVVRRGTELTVHWEGPPKEDTLVRARTPNTPQVFAMFRIFGEPHFQVGSTTDAAAGWTQFLVPDGQPVVVCVVDKAQATTLSASAVPKNQCSEVSAEKVSDSQLNKIIIGSSAAVCGMIVLAVVIFVCCSRRSSGKHRQQPRPVLKSDHEWDTASFYSGRSIPRARAYHGGGSVNPSYLPPDDVQSFRSLPPAPRGARAMVRGGEPSLHHSQIALSQLSGPHSFLGAYGAEPQSTGGWGHHWDAGDAYSERHAPSRLSYGKDFG